MKKESILLDPNLIFIKLGGSLITDKGEPRTPRLKVISNIAEEIKTILTDNSDLRILLGHGSGSFGHVPASKYRTRDGVRTQNGWIGFTKVWLDARRLNQLVMEAFNEVVLPAISSTCV